ncbi:amidohydrolase family protein [Pseudonocardia kujensis]|uniref:amidohydrolase family protein n=1 Tax=Pseudonocardia kujensis TaxID=1128675 RepID=UPI001E3F2484|nr:amidohydrolase family protein [Pseudonocardia kujensis]MCE0763496.1 amidohydrolase family protein [Pseudonocardia kujensis]
MSSTTDQKRVDVHAHFLPRGLQPSAESPLPRLELDTEDTGRIMMGDSTFRRVHRPLWDVEARVARLDEAGLDVQVVSPVPITLTVQDAGYLHEQNILLADEVARSDGRLLAFGAVPLWDTDAAVAEIEVLAATPGLVGIETGTTTDGLEFDAPELEPVLAAAQEHDLPLFVHPTGQDGAIRRRGAPYTFGIGMHTDTALVGAALVFGGVLEKFPRLRVALSHGCGSLPWTFPRMTYLLDDAATAQADALLRRIWCDTLVFEPTHLAVLARSFGADHLLLGTDDPFYPSPLVELLGITKEAVAVGALSSQEAAAVETTNAWEFLGIDQG